MEKFDDDPAGILTAYSPNGPKYRVREIIKFCKEHKIEPEDLSERQLSKFVIKAS